MQLAVEDALISDLQIFYAHRVRVVSRRLGWAIASWVMIVARVAIAIVALAIACKTTFLTVMLEHRYLIDLSIGLSILVRFSAIYDLGMIKSLNGVLGRLLEHSRAMLAPVAGTEGCLPSVCWLLDPQRFSQRLRSCYRMSERISTIIELTLGTIHVPSTRSALTLVYRNRHHDLVSSALAWYILMTDIRQAL
jgi:hypothetical protein